jgi:hypothetical protein
MAKRIIKVEPASGGVGQDVTFEDGSTEFDAFGTATVDADPSAPADVDLTIQRFEPPAGAPSPEQAAQLSPNSAVPVGQLAPALGSVGDVAPTQPRQGETVVDKPFELTPGAADMQPPPEQSSLVQVMMPGRAGGFQPDAKQIKGYAEEDRNALGQGALDVAAQTMDVREKETQGQEELVSSLETQALNQYLKAETQALATAAEQKRNNIVQANIQTKMKDVAAFRPNRTELFEGTAGGFRALLAGIGMIAGGALAGLNGGRNYAMDAVFKMIDDNVQQQVAQNSAIYQNLVGRLGDEQAAASILRAKHAESVVSMTKALELTAKTKEARAALAGARERAQLEATQGVLKAQEALAPQETLALAYRAPTPAAIYTIDRDMEAFKALGVEEKQVQEFMSSKVSGQQNAQTVGQTVQYMKEMDQDAATLRAIAAANDGVLPGVDQILSPSRSPMMRSALARLGVEHDVSASEVYKIFGSLVAKRAKSYGGAITESDLEMAKGEIGVTSGQVIDFIGRMRNEANGYLRGAAYGFFQGRSQPVLDIITHGIGNMSGFRQDKGRPR